MFLHVCGWFIERVCRENSETKDGAKPRTGPEGAVKPTEGRLYEQKAFQNSVLQRNVSFSTIVFFETVLLDVRTKMKNVFNKYYVFCL